MMYVTYGDQLRDGKSPLTIEDACNRLNQITMKAEFLQQEVDRLRTLIAESSHEPWVWQGSGDDLATMGESMVVKITAGTLRLLIGEFVRCPQIDSFLGVQCAKDRNHCGQCRASVADVIEACHAAAAVSGGGPSELA